MGLYDSATRIKPAGNAAQLALRLLSSHRAIRVDSADRNSFVFRFGPNTYVMWGAPRALHFSPGARFFDAEGKSISPIDRLSNDPVIVTGDVRYTFGPSEILADSLYQFAGAPWSYFARRNNGEMLPLKMIDWTWTSYYGAMDLRPLELRSASAIAAGDQANPVAPTLRYTAPNKQSVKISGCFSKKRDGDGVRVTAYQNGKAIQSSAVVDNLVTDGHAVQLNKGDTLDFAFSPAGSAEGNALNYRIRLIAPDSHAVVTCT
jgi:hypothetical protein